MACPRRAEFIVIVCSDVNIDECQPFGNGCINKALEPCAS